MDLQGAAFTVFFADHPLCAYNAFTLLPSFLDTCNAFTSLTARQCIHQQNGGL